MLALISCLAFGQLKADVEPNDDIASANPLDLATEVSGTLNTGETDADDYYELDLPENGLVEVSIDYDGAGGFAYLYRSNGVQITFVSVVDGSPTLLSADCIGSGIIYVRLSSSGEVNYSLEVNLTPPADAEDAEPNGSLAAANEIFQANQTFSGQLGYIGEESGNVTDTQDWFYVVLDSDGDVTLTVEKDNAFSGFIYIHEKDGTQLTFASANELVNSVTAPCLAQDTIVVRITHSSGCGSYIASVSVAPPVFAGDQEPNGSLSAAQEVLQISEEFTGRLGYSDADTGTDTDDWFFVVTGDDGELTFDLESTGTLNGFFYFYEKDGTQITNTSYNNGNNQLTVNCIANDTVAVRIIRSAGCGSYNASISVTPPPNAGDQEPNGAFENIIETFDANQTFTGRLGYSDADTGIDSNDWYEVVLDDDGLAAFEITPSGTFNGFIYFYSKAGVQLANTSFAANTQTTLLYDCIAEDTVVVRVLRSAGCGSYSAVVSVTPPDLAGDVEPNGAFGTFREIFATDEEFTGRLGYFDTDTGTDLEDWYEVVLSNDGTATLDILSTGSLNGFIYIYTKAGVLNSFVAYQDGEPQSLSASCLAQDTVAVRITRSSGCGSYTASLGVSPDIYANDPEPNNSFGDAVLTNGGVVNEGHLGYFDVDTGTDSDDYYTFVVGEAPFTVDAELQVVGSLSGFMYFYNESGSLLVNTTYSEGQNILSYEFTEEGTYFFRVLRSSGCGQYQLAPLCGTNPDVSIVEGDQMVCPGETPVEFSATPGIANYEWVFDGQIVGTESTLGANEPGDYFVRGIDANGCIGVSETVSLDLFNVPALSVNPTGPIELCEGESETLLASGGFASYLWSNGASGQSIDVTESGSFSVTATTAEGCSAESNQVVVDVKDVPGLNIVADGPTEFCEGESVTLSAKYSFDSYIWSKG